MSSLSKEQADALRLWLQITSAIYGPDGRSILAANDKPAGWMILAHVAIQPGESSSYASIRAALALEPASLTQALTPLIGNDLVASSPSRADAREKQVHLTPNGREAIGTFLTTKLGIK